MPGGRFVLLDLRMPDNWLRHLAPALIWLVRPFIATEVAKRQPWKSLRQHFPQYSYQKGYLGIVYIAIGQSGDSFYDRIGKGDDRARHR